MTYERFHTAQERVKPWTGLPAHNRKVLEGLLAYFDQSPCEVCFPQDIRAITLDLVRVDLALMHATQMYLSYVPQQWGNAAKLY